MQKPKYFLIDSRDRISGSSHNFRIQMTPGIQPIKRVKACGVSLPLTNYIIDSTNNMIYLPAGHSASLNPGVYDYATILVEIKRALDISFIGTVTVTYDLTTFKFTITALAPFTLDFENTYNSAAYILGFSNVNTAMGLSHTSDDVAHLSIPPYFFINIDHFSSESITTNGDHCSFIIFSQNNSGYVNFHWDKTHYSLNINGPPSKEALQYFGVNLKQRGGNYFNLNNTDWSILLELEYY